MTADEIIPGFEARLALYKVDDDARATLAKFWPAYEPFLEQAIEELVAAMSEAPAGDAVNAAKIVREQRDAIKRFELAHFQILLGGKFDEHYAQSCKQTVEQETAAGLDARVRCNFGNCVLRSLLETLARRRPITS